MEFRVLGPLEVVDGATNVRLDRPKERRLLAVLLTRAGETVSTDALAEAIWPDGQRPANPVGALQTIVSRLRGALGRGTLVASPAGYQLVLAGSSIDADRFERRLGEARSALRFEPEAALVVIDEALGLWRGRAYEEFLGEPFARAAATRMEELRMVAIETRIEARVALGSGPGLVAELEVLVARYSLSEHLRQHLMVALYCGGRQAEALAAFQSYRRFIADELGLEPSPAIRRVEQEILTHRLRCPAGGAGPQAPTARLEEELGVPATRMIGRAAVAEEVLGRVREARLITLIGPGGVGKTRLAAAVATAAQGWFSDGVTVCCLAPVRDPVAVPGALGTALGVRQRQQSGMESSLVDVLRTKALLLVLDNCEHVIDGAADLTASLLRRCPGLTVLATSRTRLGLAAEQIIDVKPLSVPGPGSALVRGTAVELFCERARTVGVDVAAGSQAMDTVAEICRRLDGLPLAVELAAAHLRIMGPAELAERLTGVPPALEARVRDITDRHRSLRGVTDWSYQLLPVGERELFDGLSVFAGSFDQAAAEAVSAATGNGATTLAGLLGNLVEVSLLTLAPGPGPTRYALLETLRGYGREQLARRDAEPLWREAHARHYLRLAQQADHDLDGPAEAEWMERLRCDMGNLREARRWGLDHDLDLAVRLVAALGALRVRMLGHPELELWCVETAEAAPDHPLSPLLLGGAAFGAASRGELDHARQLAERALSSVTGDEHSTRTAHEALGAVCFFAGDFDGTLEHYERAAALNRQAGDRYHEGWCLCMHAFTLTFLGRPAQAAEEFDDGEEIMRGLGSPTGQAWFLWARGEILIETAPDQALTLLDRAAGLARGATSPFIWAVAATTATTVRARCGQTDVFPRLRELIDHWHGTGNRTQLWVMLRSLIHLLVQTGHYEPAAVLLGALQTSATAPVVFGADHERLAEAARSIAVHASIEDARPWEDQGRAMDDHEAIAYATAAVDRVLRRGGLPGAAVSRRPGFAGTRPALPPR